MAGVAIPSVPVTAADAAVVVLAYLQASPFRRTCAAFVQESQHLTGRVQTSSYKPLPVILSEYIGLKAHFLREKAFSQAFVKDPHVSSLFQNICCLVSDYAHLRESLQHQHLAEAESPRGIDPLTKQQGLSVPVPDSYLFLPTPTPIRPPHLANQNSAASNPAASIPATTKEDQTSACPDKRRTPEAPAPHHRLRKKAKAQRRHADHLTPHPPSHQPHIELEALAPRLANEINKRAVWSQACDTAESSHTDPGMDFSLNLPNDAMDAIFNAVFAEDFDLGLPTGDDVNNLPPLTQLLEGPPSPSNTNDSAAAVLGDGCFPTHAHHAPHTSTNTLPTTPTHHTHHTSTHTHHIPHMTYAASIAAHTANASTHTPHSTHENRIAANTAKTSTCIAAHIAHANTHTPHNTHEAINSTHTAHTSNSGNTPLQLQQRREGGSTNERSLLG